MYQKEQDPKQTLVNCVEDLFENQNQNHAPKIKQGRSTCTIDNKKYRYQLLNLHDFPFHFHSCIFLERVTQKKKTPYINIPIKVQQLVVESDSRLAVQLINQDRDIHQPYSHMLELIIAERVSEKGTELYTGLPTYGV